MKESNEIYYPWNFDTDLMVKFIQEPKLIHNFNAAQLKGIDSLEDALQEVSRVDFNKEKLLSCINLALCYLSQSDTGATALRGE